MASKAQALKSNLSIPLKVSKCNIEDGRKQKKIEALLTQDQCVTFALDCIGIILRDKKHRASAGGMG